jgi:spore germination cell wall hydrolase CwlJ-like protein
MNTTRIKQTALLLALSAQLSCADTLTTVALTLWGEARNQSFDGKHAVGSVIWTRAQAKPSKLSAVCLDRKQFSCWQKGKFTQARPDMRKPIDRKSWSDCVVIAGQMVDGSFLPSLKSKHYHEASIQPYWSVNMKMLASVGSHKFYK